MLKRLEEKRADLMDDIAIMELDLERAKAQLDLLDEIITDENDFLDDNTAEENGTNEE